MTQRKPVSQREPYGLGGWLIGTAISLVISPLLMLYSLYTDVLPSFQQGHWQMLTTPGTAVYHPLWAPVLIFELAGNLLFLCFLAVLLYLFFTKSYRFPRLFVVFLASYAAFAIGDILLSRRIPAVAAQLDAAGIPRNVASAVVGAAIWIPYFLRSKRVKNTFVKGRPGPGVQEAKRHLELAHGYEARDEFASALSECELALQLAPGLGEAHNLRGVILESLGRGPEAVKAYREAVRLDPRLAEAWQNLAEAEAEFGQQDAREDTVVRRSTVSLDPGVSAAAGESAEQAYRLDAPPVSPTGGRAGDISGHGLERERETGMAMNCDLCNTPGAGTLVSAEQMREAVFESGFDPYELELITFAFVPILGKQQLYEDWKNTIVAQDTSDSNICAKCMAELRPYLKGAPEDTGIRYSAVSFDRGQSAAAGAAAEQEYKPAALPASAMDQAPAKKKRLPVWAIVLPVLGLVVLFAAWLVVWGPLSERAADDGTLTGQPSQTEPTIVPDPELAEAYVSHGNAHLSEGNYDQAIADYDQAIALDPQYAAAYNNRGNAYRSKGDLDRAIADYDLAIALDPQYAAAYNNRGNAYSDKGDLDQAIADYDQAIALDPQLARAYHGRGVAYERKGDPDRALADYDQLIELDPLYAVAYHGRGLAYYNKGDLDRAIADYDQLIALDPLYVAAYNNRGLAYYDKGDYDQAIANYDQAIALDPKYVSAYYGRGLAYHATGDYDQAIADLETALELATDPEMKRLAEDGLQGLRQNPPPSSEVSDLEDAEEYLARGNDHALKGDLDHAIADFDQAIALDPQTARAYHSRGLAYAHKGDYDQAIADFDQAITLEPQNAAVYSDRGNAYHGTGDLERAITDFDQAVALDPQYAEAYNNRGIAYYDKGNPDRAIADYDQAIALDPRYAAAHSNRGNAYLLKGDVDQAIADYDQAIALDPQFGNAYANRAIANYRMGDLDRAIADLGELLELEPANAWAYYSRGLLHKELGQRDEAIADLERALALTTSSEMKQDTEELLEELRGG